MVKSLVDPFAVKELPFQVPNAKFSVPVPTVAVALENPPNTSVCEVARLETLIEWENALALLGSDIWAVNAALFPEGSIH